MDTHTNHTHIEIKIPLLSMEAAELFKSYIISELSEFPIVKSFETYDLNSIYVTFIFLGVENVKNIEKIIDTYVNEHTRIRYCMLIFRPSARFPSSIRTNSKGKKVLTKEHKVHVIL